MRFIKILLLSLFILIPSYANAFSLDGRTVHFYTIFSCLHHNTDKEFCKTKVNGRIPTGPRQKFVFNKVIYPNMQVSNATRTYVINGNAVDVYNNATGKLVGTVNTGSETPYHISAANGVLTVVTSNNIKSEFEVAGNQISSNPLSTVQIPQITRYLHQHVYINVMFKLFEWKF